MLFFCSMSVSHPLLDVKTKGLKFFTWIKLEEIMKLRSCLIILCFFNPFLYSNENSNILGGFAKINITPDTPVTMSGFANRTELSTGVHDSLYARVVALQAGDGQIVLVSTDVIGFYDGTAQIISAAICKEFNLAPAQLFLAAIHNHSGPTVTLDEKQGHANNIAYTKKLQQKLITAVGKALKQMQPIRIGLGTGSSPVGVNRREVYYDELGNPRMWIGRNPYGIQDKEVSVLKISTGDDKPAAVLWDYATHSTSLGWENFLISGDVHGIAERFIEKYLADKVIAPGFAGASGDIDPWYRVLPGFESTNGWIPEPVLLGTLLGEEVVHVLRTIAVTSKAVPIRSMSETVELPGKASGSLTTSQDTPPSSINITVARVGNIAFVGLGAEVLSEIGMAIKEASPFEHTVIITHCNGAADYIAPQHLFVEGGYEVESSPFASTAAELLVKRVVKMLHEL
jgi:neutral ceramidase